MSHIMVAAYRPKPGQERLLDRVIGRQHARLLAEGLVTERAPILMRAANGTILEVVEWHPAIADADASPTVIALRRELAEIADAVPLADVAEARAAISRFEPMESAEALHPELSP